MLKSMDNWGTFLFFAGWCAIALLYVFVAVPETAGLSLEAIDKLFEGPFWQMSKQAKKQRENAMVIASPAEDDSVEDLGESFPKGDKDLAARAV